jgi:uncharacterized alpha-E superfamily protein
MKSVKQYNWLQVVEGCSVVSCIVGSIVSVVSQQLMFVSVPLAVALSLNFINRSKFQQQIRQYNKTTVSEMHEAINSLDQQAQTLPNQSLDLDSIFKSLLQVEQTTHTLAEQFNTRPETQEVKQLKTEISKLNNLFNTLSVRFDNLPTYAEVNTSEIERTITNFSSQLDTLRRQVNAKPEVQAIEELKEAYNQNTIHINQQLETVQQQVFVLNERTNSSPNLHDIQERLDFLQHLMTEYVKTEYLENLLLELCEEFSKQIDRVVELQVAEINQQLKVIQPGDK